jgi:hypothetical protein
LSIFKSTDGLQKKKVRAKYLGTSAAATSKMRQIIQEVAQEHDLDSGDVVKPKKGEKWFTVTNDEGWEQEPKVYQEPKEESDSDDGLLMRK